MAQSKFWCFTLNNYSDADVLCCRRLVDSEEDCTYLVFGRELSSSGTPHLQGYVEFGRRVRRSRVLQLLGGHVHLEQRRGTSEEASAYCKKDGDFEEFGVISQPRQGKRTDLDQIRESITNGATEREIADGHFSQWVVYRNSFEKYRDLITDDGIRHGLRIIVLWGLPGTGKSRYAYEQFPDLYSVASPTLQWFDGYRGEEVVLVDDYRGGADEGFLLKFLDIYPLRLPVKGSFVRLRAMTIIITSNIKLPFGHVGPEICGALRRRVSAEVEVQAGMTSADIDVVVQEQINS